MKWSAESPAMKTSCSTNTFYPEYQYCMKSELPTTNTITVNPNNLENYLYVKLDPPKWIDTYTQNCKGDSGSGQFISNNKQLPEDVMEFRYILVAIHESSTKDLFKDKNGKLHNVPCGAYTYSRKTKKYLKSIGVSISTTWAKHLNWIKQKSNI